MAAALIIGAQGCGLFKAKPTPPATWPTATIVGVAHDFELTPTATIYKLADGRTVAEVYAEKEVQGGLRHS